MTFKDGNSESAVIETSPLPELEIDNNYNYISSDLPETCLISFCVCEPLDYLNTQRDTAGCNTPGSPDISFSTKTDDDSISERTEIEMVRLTKHPVDRSPIKDSETLCLSFGGCGFLGSYQFGAAKVLRDHGKRFLDRVHRFAGCSSGSLVAALLVLNPGKITDASDDIYKVADEVNSLPLGIMTPGFSINHRLRNAIEKYIPEDISEANDRLFLSVTHVKTWKNKMISTFKDREELIDVLMASCYHPMYSSGISGKAPILSDGEMYIDGGYTNILPEFLDTRTVSVTPFSGDADICPEGKSVLFNDAMLAVLNQNMKLTFSNVKRFTMALVPPRSDRLKKFYQLGEKDAERVLKENDLFND